MRTIENIQDDQIVETLFIFSSEAEREAFFALSYEGAQRNHKKNLEELKLQYQEDLKANPSDAAFILETYRERIRKQHESYYRDIGQIRKNKQGSRLESELIPL